MNSTPTRRSSGYGNLLVVVRSKASGQIEITHSLTKTQSNNSSTEQGSEQLSNTSSPSFPTSNRIPVFSQTIRSEPHLNGKMVLEVKRTVKLITEQATIPGRPDGMEGFPMKEWSIEIFLLDEAGTPCDSSIIAKATYNLHPSFENPIQTFDKPPFRCQNEGWGEFDMTIDLYFIERGGRFTISHDLNFAKPRYESKHSVTFKNPTPQLLALLSKSGPIPGDDANGARKKADEGKKRKRIAQVDMDKLADGLVKLPEDDLLQVVQMIHDNKTDETYTKNDIENGEFHVDLYTCPDPLVRMLWDFVQQKVY